MGVFEDKINIEDKEAAVMVVHGSIAGIAHRSKLLGLEMNENRLVNELTNMIYCYLRKK
ncbi:MAG: hypothetical protein GY866_16135 [Proteobacteria bacterium]|nr:hypothetical protein [Pseudomonadota bacterium]